MTTPVAVYVHLPFCPYLCPYCDFAKWPYRASDATRYLAALEAQIDASPRRTATTLFFGGGTPNTYEPATIGALIASVRERFSLPATAEISLEANPDPALCLGFPALREAGVNRLSIGAQSFDATELATLGRRHSAEDIAAAVRLARAAGFDSISLDLMFAIPGQSNASFTRSLEAAFALDVDHVSAYGLTVEEGTPYERWFARDPGVFFDDEREARLYEIAIERAAAAGYEQYEISNFARPGKRCAHNATYWANGEYVGLGVGAASYIDGVRSVTTRDLATYVAAASANETIPAESERLEGDARLGEATMLALRTLEGVNIADFRERYDVDFLAKFGSVIDTFRSSSLLSVDAGHVRLTRRGRFLANDVCGAFLSLP